MGDLLTILPLSVPLHFLGISTFPSPSHSQIIFNKNLGANFSVESKTVGETGCDTDLWDIPSCVLSGIIPTARHCFEQYKIINEKYPRWCLVYRRF